MKWKQGFLDELSSLEAERIYHELSDSRKKRIDRFKREDDKRRSILGEKLLKNLLQSEFGLENIIIESAENGKPFIKHCDLFVSISHSGAQVTCAVSEHPVGIDVELITPIKKALVDRVCTKREKDYVLSGCVLGEEITDFDVLTRFFEIWTGKEAYFKMQGTGITDFQSVEVLDLERVIEITENSIITIIENR